jgi:hypothetical protein
MDQQEYISPDDAQMADIQPESQLAQPAHRMWLPFEINWSALLLIVVLIILTVTGLLANQNLLSEDVYLWWPLALIAPAGIWFLASMARRRPRGLLGSMALLGIGISFLLSQQGILPVSSSIVGITLIALGTGIMLRGLLMRNQPIM